MSLPNDFASNLEKVQNYGILDEGPTQIRNRLVLSLHGVAATQSTGTVDLGPLDWAGTLLHDFDVAVHEEICDPQGGCLKKEYKDLLTQGLSANGIASVAAVVLKVVATINPAFAVSSVGIYMAVWLLKVGLNYWCGQAEK